jgi:hypothetical protein
MLVVLTKQLGELEPELTRARSIYPERQLEYSNMLVACKGGEGKKLDRQHCDTRKGNSSLSFNPADPSHNIEEKVRFLGD